MRAGAGLARRTALNAFARGASCYARDARLQQAVAWRLARHCRGLPLLEGPVVDLGAGSGNLSRALAAQRPGLESGRQLPELGGGRRQQAAAAWDLSRHRLRCASAEQLPAWLKHRAAITAL